MSSLILRTAKLSVRRRQRAHPAPARIPEKAEAVSEQDLAQFNDRVPDIDLMKVLCAQNLLSTAAAEQIQTRQVADVLRLALLWTEGTWEFDSRSRLDEQLNPRSIWIAVTRSWSQAAAEVCRLSF